MKFVSIKQYVKYAAPMITSVVLLAGVTSGIFVNQPEVSAAQLKTVADCRNQFKPANPQNANYVICVNNDTYEAMIYRAYKGVLGRAPESNPWLVYDYWLPIAKSSSNPTLTVVSKMMKSSEYRNSEMGKLPADGEAGFESSDNIKWVKLLYPQALDRQAVGDEAYIWASSMQSQRGYTGKSRAQVASEVIQSKEAKNAPGSVINAPCYIAHDSCAD